VVKPEIPAQAVEKPTEKPQPKKEEQEKKF